MKVFYLSYPKFLLFIFITTVFNLTAQEISTVGEIYDFEVGDEFHIDENVSSFGYNCAYGHYSYTNIKILDKYFNSSNDKLFYIRDIKNLFSSSDYPDEVFSEFIDTISFTNLNSLINEGEIDSVGINPNEYNGRAINYFQNGEGAIYSKWKYVDGCGEAYYKFFHWEPDCETSMTIELVYYKKGDEEWGTPNIIISTEEKHTIENLIQIYPNPAKDIIQISLEDFIIKEVILFNQTGQKALSIEYPGKIIDISNLLPGLYFAKIKTSKGVLMRKMVVQ